MDFDSLAKLIERNRGDAIDFGHPNCDLNPTAARIQETEDLIGAKLPPSYLWFVNNYGGGEVYGEEIFSIYSTLSEQSIGDIGRQTKRERDGNYISNSDVVVCTNNFGETFTMDTSVSSSDGEYPVYVQRGKYRELYADNFAAFLAKRILDVES